VSDLNGLTARLTDLPRLYSRGQVTAVTGTLIEAMLPCVQLGAVVDLGGSLAEVVGMRQETALLLPLGDNHGLQIGAEVSLLDGTARVPVGDLLLGRIVDALGRPADGGPSLDAAPRRALNGSPPDAVTRTPVESSVQTGIRAIDGFLTLGRGQRIAIMAGTGVGKSTLLGMITRNSDVDVVVAALVGERGREVREFVDHQLGPEARARSVLVQATSDVSPVLQVRAVRSAMAIAEEFRDQGKHVLLVIDSITRLAMAQRRIGLAAGEPPTTRGYPPSVFSLIPAVLERAGAGSGVGAITLVATVLVEGDDLQDPIGDTVRGVVDGHVVLSRKLGDRGHFPAIDILASLSRTMPSCTERGHQLHARKVRRALALWTENEELLRLGAYHRGTDKSVDAALDLYPALEAFLIQDRDQFTDFDDTLGALEQLAGRV
jgi:flagellum-specific ATP synthase